MAKVVGFRSPGAGYTFRGLGGRLKICLLWPISGSLAKPGRLAIVA